MRSAFLARFSATALLVLLSFSFAFGEHSRALITAPINEASRVTLSGNTHPDATAQNDLGRVSDNFPMEHLQLLLRRPAEQEAALERHIVELQTPGSSSYHHWLTAAEFGDRYGVA